MPIYLRDSKFIISSAARTGSTYFLTLLRSHPDIMVHGESLKAMNSDHAPGMIWGSYHQKRGPKESNTEYVEALKREMRARPERFIQSILFDSQDRKVAGFKYKTEEAFDPAYKAYSDVIFGDTDIKVIHLIRRNLLDQYISHTVLLDQTHVFLIHDEKDRPEMRPFVVDVPRAVAYCADVVRREKQALDTYARHRSIQVEYENLVHDESDHRTAALDFLGVPQRPLSTGTKKIIKDSRALVINLEEVIEGLRRAGFENRLS